MVSGFVTSPCDQLRIFSGEARLMRMASKSAIGFARSNGLERNKISSTPAAVSRPQAAPNCRDVILGPCSPGRPQPALSEAEGSGVGGCNTCPYTNLKTNLHPATRHAPLLRRIHLHRA